jgi:FkbM family methyltransferase
MIPSTKIKKPLLTIAIPTYNRGTRLDLSLHHLLSRIKQSNHHARISVYVSDNGSTDNTLSVIKNHELIYKEKEILFQYNRFNGNNGFDSNVIKCYAGSPGEYIWFLSDDDNIMNGSIQQIINYIDQFTPEVIYFNFYQQPFTYAKPLIKKDVFFPIICETNLEALVKIISWPKLSSLVIKKSKDGLLVKDDKTGFAHLSLAILCSIRNGRLLHSRFFIAYPDADYYDHIDFPPYIVNNINDAIKKTIDISGANIKYENLCQPFIDPVLMSLQYLGDIYRNGTRLNKNVEAELINLINKSISFRNAKTLNLKMLRNYFIYCYSCLYKYYPLILFIFMRKKLREKFESKKNMTTALKKLISNILIKPSKFRKNSYSQSGEDILISAILNNIRRGPHTYLDIGANHPYNLSNTYLLYEQGGHGVLVEPDKNIFKRLKSKRRRDICLNVGVSFGSESNAEFYIMSADVLNTFSREEAERVDSMGTYKIKNILTVPLMPINNIIEKNFKNCPDLISIDVEGLDLEIISTLDFQKYRPSVFCIETLTYSENKTEKKLKNIIEFMISKDYFVYADTYLNTIFVDRNQWLNR